MAAVISYFLSFITNILTLLWYAKRTYKFNWIRITEITEWIFIEVCGIRQPECALLVGGIFIRLIRRTEISATPNKCLKYVLGTFSANMYMVWKLQRGSWRLACLSTLQFVCWWAEIDSCEIHYLSAYGFTYGISNLRLQTLLCFLYVYRLSLIIFYARFFCFATFWRFSAKHLIKLLNLTTTNFFLTEEF